MWEHMNECEKNNLECLSEAFGGGTIQISWFGINVLSRDTRTPTGILY